MERIVAVLTAVKNYLGHPVRPGHIIACGLLPALIAFGVYWPARLNEFVWDDWAVVDRLADNLASVSWLEVLLRPPAGYAALFRPVTMLTILLPLWAGQTGPQPFHLANLFIHSANVFLLTLLAWRLLDQDSLRAATRLALAAACGLLYGIHPALTEPVIWISARSDLLMTFFLCLALLLDRSLAPAGWPRALAVSGAFLAAMLCKEAAVGLLPALPLVHLGLARPVPRGLGPMLKGLKQHFRVYCTLLGALVLYFAARLAVSGLALGLTDMESPASHIKSFGEHALVVVASLAHYVSGAIWPFQNLAPGRHLPLPINALSILPLAAASAAVILLALAAARSEGAVRTPGWLFLAFLAALVPVLNIIPIPAVTMKTEIGVASRYLTFPLVFVCLAAPCLVHAAGTALAKRVRIAWVLTGIVAGAWILGSLANVRVIIPLWKDDAVLNNWAIRQDGPSAWRYANLGAHYVRKGMLPEARDAYLKLIELRPGHYFGWYALGSIYASLNQVELAIDALRRGLVLNPDNYMNRIRLAVMERSRERPAAAIELLEEGVRRPQDPGFEPQFEGRMRLHLGLAYLDIGRTDDAVKQFSAARGLVHTPDDLAEVEQALQAARAGNRK